MIKKSKILCLSVILAGGLETAAADNLILGLEDNSLHQAVRENDLERVKDLVEIDMVDIDATDTDSCTPIQIAAKNNYIKIVHYLTKQGAELNITDGLEGKTPLHFLAGSKHSGTTLFLIMYGAALEITDKIRGRTALHFAAHKGVLKTVKILVHKGSNIHKKDYYQQTALHIAAQHGHHNVVKYLIENDADFTITNNQNQTPRDLARTNNFLAIEKYLTLAEDFPNVVNNSMTVQTFFKTHGFTQQVLNDVFGLAIMTGSYETLEKLYDFDPSTFSATINGLTKIDFTASPAKSLSWYVQLLGIAIASSSTKLFHKIITISHAIDGLPSIINGAFLQTEKLEKPSDTELVTQIKELRKAWVTACKEKEKRYFISHSINLLKTKFALEQKTYQENTFENKKLIKTEVTQIPNYIAPQVLSFLSTSDFVKTKK